MSGACCMSIDKEERGEKEEKDNSTSVAINISSCLANSILVKHKIV
jgi:hypothetical protein